ncbi:uncharacterized protein [Centruroides vittatus]|uniref:uncharacterized protein n=1 Tax=Centruroides vittatus TaxID=120091 RepID=UPI00350F46BA
MDECIQCILSYLNKLEGIVHEDDTGIVAFLKEQVLLLPVCKTRSRYSCSIMVFFSLLYSISPHAYKFLRSANIIKIPSPSTIRRVCAQFQSSPQLEQDTSSMLRYVSFKSHLLKEEEKTVILQIDEIHLRANSDYKGGSVVGNAFGTEELATSAYVFMISSLSSSYKEVVHILPVKTIRGDILHTFLKKIIVKLEEIGFTVVAVVSDNNSINSKAMSFFSKPPSVKTEYCHPSDSNRKLFFVIDPVHILKCIRNNWLNKVNQDMIYPDFNDTSTVPQIASFSALKQLHSNEKLNLLKYGVNLSLKSLYPSDIERQNVKLVLHIFTPSTYIAMRELGCVKHFDNWETTANYIEVICRWWDIVNVKTPLKGLRLRNPFQEPITKNSDHIISFLQKFLNWLQRWEKLHDAAMLTRETHFALKHTTHALLQIAQFWIYDKGNSYFLFFFLRKIIISPYGDQNTPLFRISTAEGFPSFISINLYAIQQIKQVNKTKSVLFLLIAALASSSALSLPIRPMWALTHLNLMVPRPPQLLIIFLISIARCYFLCGKLQTDNLEDRFGRYRQLAGSHYHISICQLYECETKLRIQTTVPLILKSHTFGEVSLPLSAVPEMRHFIKHAAEDYDCVLPQSLINNCHVDDDDIDIIQDSVWPLLTYIAGYTSYAMIKKFKCDYCQVFLCSQIDDDSKENKAAERLIRATDRGGLCYPHIDVVTCMSYVYVIVNKLLSKENEETFLQQRNQRGVIVALSLINKPENIFLGHNCRSHSTSNMQKNILHIASNIFLNNYTKRKNDDIRKKTMPQCKRMKVGRIH